MGLATLLFSPRGRIAPPAFWTGFAVLSLTSVGVLFVPFVGGFLWLASFVPWAFLNAKRLHDMNLSGWVQAVPYAVNLGLAVTAGVLIGWAVFLAMFTKDPVQATLDASTGLGTLAFLLLTVGLVLFNTAWLVWIGGTPGSRDQNRFGPPPGHGAIPYDEG